MDFDEVNERSRLQQKTTNPSAGKMVSQEPVTCRLIFTILSAVLGSFQFGYNTGVINAPQKLIEDFMNQTQTNRSGNPLPDSTISLLWATAVALFAVGGMIGGVMAGVWADRFGRRRGLLLANIFSLVAAALMGLSKVAKSFEMIFIGRIVVGFSSGIFTGVVPMYITEVSPSHIRGALGTVNQLGVVLGLLISQLLGMSELLGTDTLWPLLLGLTAAPAILQIVTLPFCPRSPRYLLITLRQEKDAMEALVTLRGIEQVQNEIDEMKAEEKSQEGQTKMSMCQVLSSSSLRLPLVVSVIMHLSQQFSGVNVVFYYSTQVFKDAGIEENLAAKLTIGVGGIMVLMTFVSIPLMDRVGRRTLHLAGLGGLFLCSILITVGLFLRSDYSEFKYIVVAASLLFVVFFAIGPGSIPWMIVAELFSQGPRPAAVSIGVLVNWAANFTVGLSFPPMQKAIGNYSFIPFSALTLIFLVILFKYLPETKNKTFEEISALFKKPSRYQKEGGVTNGGAGYESSKSIETSLYKDEADLIPSKENTKL